MKKVILQGIIFCVISNAIYAQSNQVPAEHDSAKRTEATYPNLWGVDWDGPNSAFDSWIQPGSIFGICLNAGNWGYTDEYNFKTDVGSTSSADVDGFNDLAMCDPGLTLAADGNLYGTTRQGGAYGLGGIFEFNVTTLTYTRKYSFYDARTPGEQDGTFSDSPLTQLPGTTQLWGMTQGGGAHRTSGFGSEGTIFFYDYSAGTFTKVHDFSIVAGEPVQPTDANALYYYAGTPTVMYGLSENGGADSSGALFTIQTTSPYTLTVLYSFHSGHGSIGPNGKFPCGTVVEAANAAGHPALFGTAGEGGANLVGCVFMYDLTTSTYTDIYDFKYNVTTDAYGPNGTLCLASDGNLYGMSDRGGAYVVGGYEDGAIFKINPSTYAESIVHSFGNGTDGENPVSGVMEYPAGSKNLYGVAEQGGTHNEGMIFQYNITSTAYTDIWDFSTATGSTPLEVTLVGTNVNACAILPIQLVSFTGKYSAEGDYTTLEWTTQTEVNNHYYFIERSTDSKNWQTIDTVAGADNSDHVLSYSTVDHHPPVGIDYYRLTQQDYDGHEQSFGIVPITVTTPNNTILYPNPATSIVTIEGNKLQNVTIYNLLGQVVWSGSGTDSKVTVDLEQFTNGIYIAQATDQLGNTTVLKFSKQNNGGLNKVQ